MKWISIVQPFSAWDGSRPDPTCAAARAKCAGAIVGSCDRIGGKIRDIELRTHHSNTTPSRPYLDDERTTADSQKEKNRDIQMNKRDLQKVSAHGIWYYKVYLMTFVPFHARSIRTPVIVHSDITPIHQTAMNMIYARSVV